MQDSFDITVNNSIRIGDSPFPVGRVNVAKCGADRGPEFRIFENYATGEQSKIYAPAYISPDGHPARWAINPAFVQEVKEALADSEFRGGARHG